MQVALGRLIEVMPVLGLEPPREVAQQRDRQQADEVVREDRADLERRQAAIPRHGPREREHAEQRRDDADQLNVAAEEGEKADHANFFQRSIESASIVTVFELSDA